MTVGKCEVGVKMKSGVGVTEGEGGVRVREAHHVSRHVVRGILPILAVRLAESVRRRRLAEIVLWTWIRFGHEFRPPAVCMVINVGDPRASCAPK